MKLLTRNLSPSARDAASAPAPELPPQTLKEWHPDEQPRERLMRYGPQTLATSELIAILLRTGTKRANACDVARDLLRGYEGSLRALGSRDWRELAEVHGMGGVKSVTLLAALELGRRRAIESDVERPLVRTSRAAFELLAPHLSDLAHEEAWLVLLNNASRATGLERVSTGGIDGTVVDVRSVFATALRHRATAVVLAHNHPSGSLAPSDVDRALTRRLAEAGRLMHVELRDHVIVAGRRYYSFRDDKQLGG